MNFGENLKRIRKSRGLTQTQLGELMGKKRSTIARYEAFNEDAKQMNPSHIAQIEKNHITPSIKTLVKLASALECTTDELLGYTTNKSLENKQRVGRWEVYQLKELGEAWTVQCSVCKAIGFHGKTPYCPECGAQMQ